jgi:hypothetical protein
MPLTFAPGGSQTRRFREQAPVMCAATPVIDRLRAGKGDWSGASQARVPLEREPLYESQ